jgi:SecD/SecF fusion protein
MDASSTAVLMSLLAIFLYVAVRFRQWQFGLGALVAIFHDVLIVLAVFSIFHGILPFSLEINTSFVAAILTVVGYSINDTVVVFDRIRERIAGQKSEPLKIVVNKALNSTLSRTFNTSITIAVVLIAIMIFGTGSLQGFAFALLVGVIVGTYSSICIATPIYVDLVKDDKKAE